MQSHCLKMAQLKAMALCSSSPNLALHTSVLNGGKYPFLEFGGKRASLCGNSISSKTVSLNRSDNKKVIRAVLSNDNKESSGLKAKLKKVVLAYSGGLDTSVIVPWLSMGRPKKKV